MTGDPDPGGLIALGEITGAHGVRGQVKIRSFTAEPSSIAAYGPVQDGRGRQFTITVTGQRGGSVVATLDGVTDRDGAAALQGERLYVARVALPTPMAEDEFYHADLVGLRVEAPDGTVFGEIVAIHDFGAGDVLEIGPPPEGGGPARKSGSVLVPFTRQAVPGVEIGRGRVVIDPDAAGLGRGSTAERRRHDE